MDIQVLAVLVWEEIKNKSLDELADDIGVEYVFQSSIQADENGFACGNCLSCYTRKEGFRLARIPDPTRYKSLVT